MTDDLDLDLDELERLCSEATPGPWEGYFVDDVPKVIGAQYGAIAVDVPMAADAAFIAAARTAVPKLVSRVRELQEKLKYTEHELAIWCDPYGIGEEGKVSLASNSMYQDLVAARARAEAAEARVAELEEEVERLTRGIRSAGEVVDAALHARIATLEAALRKYGEHELWCDLDNECGTSCTCGLDAALNGTDGGGDHE